MKDPQINTQINQMALAIEDEILNETNADRVCRLMDAKEYLRRAWHAVDGTPTEDNDTTVETERRMKAQ